MMSPAAFPPVYRAYVFINEQSSDMDFLTKEHFDLNKLRFETPLDINARTFYERVSHGDLANFLMEANVSFGEIVEIDDGLYPYFFYYLSWSRLVLAPSFDPSRVQK